MMVCVGDIKLCTFLQKDFVTVRAFLHEVMLWRITNNCSEAYKIPKCFDYDDKSINSSNKLMIYIFSCEVK